MTTDKQTIFKRIGDGRVVIEGETYVNEKSSRVLTVAQFNQYQKLAASNRELLEALGAANYQLQSLRCSYTPGQNGYNETTAILQQIETVINNAKTN